MENDLLVSFQLVHPFIMTRRHTPADTLLTLTETNPGQLADYVLCMVLCLVEFMSVSCKLALLLFEFFFWDTRTQTA